MRGRGNRPPTAGHLSQRAATCKSLSPVCNGDGCNARLPHRASGFGIHRRPAPAERPDHPGSAAAAQPTTDCPRTACARLQSAPASLASVQTRCALSSRSRCRSRSDVGANDAAFPFGVSSIPFRWRRAFCPGRAARFRRRFLDPYSFLLQHAGSAGSARRPCPRPRIHIRSPAGCQGRRANGIVLWPTRCLSMPPTRKRPGSW